jgi:hypothetical protein
MSYCASESGQAHPIGFSGACPSQVINLVPWGGVSIHLRPFVRAGINGWHALAAAVTQHYVDDIAKNQARTDRRTGRRTDGRTDRGRSDKKS